MTRRSRIGRRTQSFPRARARPPRANPDTTTTVKRSPELSAARHAGKSACPVKLHPVTASQAQDKYTPPGYGRSPVRYMALVLPGGRGSLIGAGWVIPRRAAGPGWQPGGTGLAWRACQGLGRIGSRMHAGCRESW